MRFVESPTRLCNPGAGSLFVFSFFKNRMTSTKDSTMADQWYYQRNTGSNDQPVGPMNAEQLRQCVTNRQIVKSDFVLSPTRTNNAWVPIEKIPRLVKLIQETGSLSKKHAAKIRLPRRHSLLRLSCRVKNHKSKNCEIMSSRSSFQVSRLNSSVCRTKR